MALLEILAVRLVSQDAAFQLSRTVLPGLPWSSMLKFRIFLLPPMWLFPCLTGHSQQPVPLPISTIVVPEKSN